ncbi:hypothetical protein ACN20G_29810 (plasmid) [Streptomyces sp. BI20]
MKIAEEIRAWLTEVVIPGGTLILGFLAWRDARKKDDDDDQGQAS